MDSRRGCGAYVLLLRGDVAVLCKHLSGVEADVFDFEMRSDLRLGCQSNHRSDSGHTVLPGDLRNRVEIEQEIGGCECSNLHQIADDLERFLAEKSGQLLYRGVCVNEDFAGYWGKRRRQLPGFQG